MPTAIIRSKRPVSGVGGYIIAGALAMLALLALPQAAAQAHSSVFADSMRTWQPRQDQRFTLTLNSQPTPPQRGFADRTGAHVVPPQPAQPVQPASLNLDFRRASAHQQAKDLLRVQLSADSVLNFRPRGGGLVVTYRAQF